MLKQALIFSAGVVVGSATTYFAVKKHFEQISREEIDSVKEAYISKCKRMDVIKNLNDEKTRLLNTIYESGYSQEKQHENEKPSPPYEDDSTEGEWVEDVDEEKWEQERVHPDDDAMEAPYSITPHQFAYEKRYYDKITLLYYKGDGILVTESDQLIEDPNATIGEETLTKFGEFEDDVAYARNDRLSIDYEVILQHSSYSDILGEGTD